MIYIRYTIFKISFSYIMYTTIILCRNYLQIVRSNYVYFGQINESVRLSVCLSNREINMLLADVMFFLIWFCNKRWTSGQNLQCKDLNPFVHLHR